VRQSAVVSRRVAAKRERQNLKRRKNLKVLAPEAKAAVWFTPKKTDRDA